MAWWTAIRSARARPSEQGLMRRSEAGSAPRAQPEPRSAIAARSHTSARLQGLAIMAACLGVVAVQLSPYTEHRAAAQDARTLGQWSSVQQWPVVSVHSHLLPTGQVMFYPYSDDVHLWDPATGNIFRVNGGQAMVW